MSWRIWAGLLLCVFLWFVVAQSCHGATIFPSQYDAQIRAATKKFWPDYPDWKSWKSQLYQESKLDPNAESAVGAEGLAQFMPATWRDIERSLGYGAISRKLAAPAIEGGAFYMATLRKNWARKDRPSDDRQRLGQASYNAGTGNIVKAQHYCGDAFLWAGIAPCLPRVTGTNFARQTTNYIIMIARWRSMM